MEAVVSRDAVKTVLRAPDLSCPSCVPKIEKHVGRVPGVRSVAVKFNSGRIEIEHAPEATVNSLVEAVSKAGYSAEPSPF